MRCCAHIMNIMVQERMRVIHSAIESVHEIGQYVNASPSCMQIFYDIAQQEVFIRCVDSHYYDNVLFVDNCNKTEIICKFL
ncbi:hypothetical protein AMTRI_Chr11g96510 [Amborella trichopoda]